MNALTLDAHSVEKIHRAVNKGVSVEEHLSQFHYATITGLVEFAFLIRSVASFSEESVLPNLVSKALANEVFSAVSVKASDFAERGEATSRADIHFIPRDLETDSWERFCSHFDQSARESGFDFRSASLLTAALHEMAENAILHSRSESCPFTVFSASKGQVSFCVSDAGIGVRGSLQACQKFGDIDDDAQAIHLAMKTGVSSLPSGGFGFREVFKALTNRWGSLRFRSGQGCVEIDGKNPTIEECTQKFLPFLPGFQVSVRCSMDEGDQAL